MTTKRELTADTRQFSFNSQAQFAMEGEGKAAKRKFSGVAYSGDVIENHWYWGNIVFELSTISVPDKLPALIDHDRSCRAGFVTSHQITPKGLEMSGTLLSSEHGVAVAQDSDDGFPWQMSVHIEPSRIEEVMQGATVSVNGRTLPGPLTVFRDSILREVSFTATGWDSKTTATAMSRPSGGLPSQPPSTGEMSMTPEQIAAMQADNARLKAESEANAKKAQDAEAAAAKFAADARTTQIKSLFAKIGREFKEDDADVLAFAKMDQAGFDVAARLLEQSAKPPQASLPAGLFSHQAQGSSTQGNDKPTNPLVADAKKRAEQFARMHGATATQFQR